MVTIEDGKYYILYGTEYTQLLHIMKMEDEEDTSYMRMFLFGGNDLAGETHDFVTPQQLLVHYIERDRSKYDLAMLAHAKEFPTYCYSKRTKSYVAIVKKKKGKTKRVIGSNLPTLVNSVLCEMSCKSLEEFLKSSTKYEAVPVFCPPDDPDDLHVNIDESAGEDKYAQIGYVIVDLEAMNELTLYKKAVYAVEDALFSLTNTEDMYAYEIYVNTADDNKEAEWEYMDSGEGIQGVDCFSNGLFEELGEEWMEAVEWNDDGTNIV